MFKIREQLKVDVYVIGDPEPSTHAAERDFVDHLDYVLGQQVGVLKIPTTPGHFVRYPIGRITSVVDYAEKVYTEARVDLCQAPDGDLYLSDPDNAEGLAYPLKHSDDLTLGQLDPETMSTFGIDGYNLIEGDVKLDELVDAQHVGVDELLHIASSDRQGRVRVLVPVDQLGAFARSYLGAKAVDDATPPAPQD